MPTSPARRNAIFRNFPQFTSICPIFAISSNFSNFMEFHSIFRLLLFIQFSQLFQFSSTFINFHQFSSTSADQFTPIFANFIQFSQFFKFLQLLQFSQLFQFSLIFPNFPQLSSIFIDFFLKIPQFHTIFFNFLQFSSIFFNFLQFSFSFLNGIDSSSSLRKVKGRRLDFLFMLVFGCNFALPCTFLIDKWSFSCCSSLRAYPVFTCTIYLSIYLHNLAPIQPRTSPLKSETRDRYNSRRPYPQA